MVRIELLPLAKVLEAERGVPLQDLLFAQGVEFPCGGRGRCKGCRVRLLAGSLPVTAEDRRLLSEAELAEGWRLACRARAESDLKIDLAQWEATILADDSVFDFAPQDGLGVAVDLGTTTIAAQLLDLRSGRVQAVRLALNAQAQFGADIMSRVDFAAAGGQGKLQTLIREQIGSLVADLVQGAGCDPARLRTVLLVGNTVMHHLFCGVDIEPLAQYPFEPAEAGLQSFAADALGWDLGARPAVQFLPCLGSFVGSDLLAGVLATRLHESEALVALVDLGTNGEIVVGNRARMLCASAAAGPAFEGARISMGMRAATGAVSSVTLRGGSFECHVLGQGPPRGICGSGLVDAAACGLEAGLIEPSGRLRGARALALSPPVEVTQGDIRELQLAKGAIAAGLRILLEKQGAGPEQLSRIYLAGAFGNYISRASARRIGLIDYPPEKVQPAGNSALLGAKMALFDAAGGDLHYASIRARTTHVPLNEDPSFEEVFAREMRFPQAGASGEPTVR